MSTDDPKQLLDDLTEREFDVLRGMASGLTNQAIADQYSISVSTVRWYTKQIYSKLGVNNRTQASMYARDLGILQDGPPAATAPPAAQLPAYPLSFVGRKRELDDISELLLSPAVRLVSIVGPGGTGKTRTAVETGRRLAEHFADGVRFIGLEATTSTDDSFLAALRRTLPSAQQQSSLETLIQALRDKEMLLLFDNFEQSREQTHIIASLLEGTHHLKILVTSQVSLNLNQEWVRRLGGLLDPEREDPAALADAMQLFVERVKQVRADFSLENHQECVIEICRLVHGLPLAIELAAAWLKTVACDDVVRELRTSPDFLATTAPDATSRHRSLEALFEHTWNLLSEDEQRIFKRLSVFQGEFGFAAAEQVAGASLQTLSALVDWSLVHQTNNNLYQLHGLVRHYAEQKLKSGQHGRQSNIAFALVSLINGDFSEIEALANKFLEDSSDELNLDKGFAIAILAVIAGASEDYERCLQLGQSSVRLTTKNPIAMLFSYLGLGIGYCGTRDHAAGWNALQQALGCARSMQSIAFINLCLPATAIVLALNDKLLEAVGIMSHIAHHPVKLPNWMEHWPLYQQLHADVRDFYEPEEFAGLWAQGKMLDSQTIASNLLSGERILHD